MALGALLLCKMLFIVRLWSLIRAGAPKDLSKPMGSVCKGVVYSYTKAMLPHHKESARLHLPTFTAGLVFHAGIFLSILTFIWFIVTTVFDCSMPQMVTDSCGGFLVATTGCGMAILLKRLFNRELRALSCADDYISNGISSLFQLATAGYLFFHEPLSYYIVASLFFLWLPMGKTRHLLYFFAARFHLGFFYGRRGSWPITRE